MLTAIACFTIVLSGGLGVIKYFSNLETKRQKALLDSKPKVYPIEVNKKLDFS